MTAAMPHRGPDGVSHWISGHIGLGHCQLRTSLAAVGESQPFRWESADLCIAMDGRLDNRHELAVALGDPHLADNTVSDAELVLRSYDRWTTKCLPRLLGDFAFALWDGVRHRLICARDVLGKRPLYFSRSENTFRFASEPQAVLADPEVSRAPNSGMLAEFLAIRPTSNSETLFRDLFRLPPAHFVLIEPDRFELARYWEWNSKTTIRYTRPREYSDHLLELFRDAVAVRLASPYPVAATLSGGVDSSSVLGVIADLLRRGTVAGELEVFSMVFPGRPCDERHHIREVARQHDLEIHETSPVAAGAAPYEEQIRTYLDLPDLPTIMMHRGHRSEARDLGCRTLFSGGRPDHWFAGSDDSLADGLRLSLDGGIEVAPHVWQYAFTPLIPNGLWEAARIAARRAACPDFFTPSFCASVNLEDRVRASGTPGSKPVTDEAVSALSSGWRLHVSEVDQRALAALGLEARDPLDDRRIIEFALAIPPDQRRRGAMTKFVLRRAMAGMIPESVRARTDQADFSHMFVDELRLQGGRNLYSRLQLAERGWVEARRVAEMYDEFEYSYRSGNPNFRRHMWALWMVMVVDKWARNCAT